MGMEGELDKLIAEKGDGVVLVERVTGKEPLGSWPGASTRAQFWMHVPRPGGELRRALLMIGIETAKNVALPVRMKITLDGAGVTREIKPQFRAELDETNYLKAVYDVTPILRRRLGRGDFHRLQAFYDLVQPVYFRDATLIVTASVEGAKYAVSALTGARVLEPGEVTVEYPPFYDSFGGKRRASLIIHSPYHEASFEVVVAGYKAGPLQGAGSFPVEVEFQYGGNLVPVSIKYLEPGYQFYPRRAVVTDIVLEETLLPRIDLGLEVENARIEGDALTVRMRLANRSETGIHRPVLALLALGGQLASWKARELPPGAEHEITLRASLRRLPVAPQTVVVSFVGYAFGKRLEKSITIQLS